jgi:hypothetical protein
MPEAAESQRLFRTRQEGRTQTGRQNDYGVEDRLRGTCRVRQWRDESAWARGVKCGVGGGGALPVGQADEKGATTGWHCEHPVRALRQHEAPNGINAPRERRRRYGAIIKDALTALWEASDRVCGKRLKVMIPTLSVMARLLSKR